MTTTTTSVDFFATKHVKQWFNELVAAIRKDEITLEIGLASKEQEEIYKVFISGDESEITSHIREATSMYFIKKILLDYIREIKSSGIDPLKLAFDISYAKVLVWAEIKDDDLSTEKKLILSEAKINAGYFQYGFHLSTTILEKSDNQPIPPQYQNALN